MQNDLKSQKQNMREQARLHRDRLNVDQSDFERVIDVFFEEFSPSKDKIIAAYWPVGKEFDCRFLLDELVKRGYQCALPVASKECRSAPARLRQSEQSNKSEQENHRVMGFVKWTHETKMKTGAWNVPEPEAGEELYPDIVLAPLLAFDQKGYRLGQGGGHYDSSLAALRERKPVTYIGIGFSEQAVLLKLPREAHDIPLDYMLTPQNVIDFER